MISFARDFIPATCLVVLAVWVILAFRTKRTLERSGSFARLAVIAVVLVVVLTRPLEHSSLHDQMWAPSSVLSFVAVVLVAIGALFAIWARITIGANWSGTVTFKQDHELMQSGPYNVVRHPIYSGLLLMGLASALANDEPYGFLLMALVVAVFIPKIVIEEKLMIEHFPDVYPQYRKRVKAIIPFIL